MYRPGDTIDVWVVEVALGSGGMGSVYRCHNHKATRILAAVKVLDTALRKFPEAEARFVREADILGQLDHPNIVHVRNVRTDSDLPYLEMEFVAGESLDDRIRRGPSPYEEVLPILRQCAEAIAYLHARGICHRDLKPANVLTTRDGTVKLVDFGLAFEMDASRLTQEGTTFGTVSYAPPEWINPDQLNPMGWDIYALGTIVVELIRGTYAFPVSGGGTARQQAMQVVVAKQGHAPLDPGPGCPESFRTLVAEMTQSDPARRLVDAAELVRRVRALPVSPVPDGATLTPFLDLEPPDSLPSDRAPRPSTRPPPAPPAVLRRAAETTPITTAPLGGRAALAIGGAGLTVVALSAAALCVLLLAVVGGLWYARPAPIAAVEAPAPAPVEPAPVEPATVEPAPATPVVPIAVEPTPAPVAPAPPKPPPPKPTGKPGAFVTVGELAAFVKANPQWQPGQTRATVAGSAYLPGWSATGPPPTAAAGAAATGVTPDLARAVCKGRGRDLPPWEAGVEDLEFRIDAGAVVLADGGPKPIRVPAATASKAVKFRCGK